MVPRGDDTARPTGGRGLTLVRFLDAVKVGDVLTRYFSRDVLPAAAVAVADGEDDDGGGGDTEVGRRDKDGLARGGGSSVRKVAGPLCDSGDETCCDEASGRGGDTE